MEAPLVEQLKRISEQLKQTREQAGIELEKVASETFIPLRLLKAMDEGKFERLPEPVFVQGFIRRYGDAVGLDGKSLSMEFAVQPPALRKPPEEYLSRYAEDDAPAAAPRNPRKSKLKVPEPLPPEPAVVPGSDDPAVSPPVPVAPTESTATTEATSSDPQASIVPAATESTAANPAADTPIADRSEPQVSETQASAPQATDSQPEPEALIAEAAAPTAAISESAPEAMPATTSAPTTDEAVDSGAATPTAEPAAAAPENATPAPEPAAQPDPAAMWAPTPIGNMSGTGQPAENNKLILGLVGVAAAALLVIGGFFLMQPKSGSDTENSASSSTQTQTTPESPTPQPTPALDAPITLNIKVTDDSWTEVIADGQIVVSEILTQGTTRTFKAQERLSITSGNAQGVTYSLNNQPEKPMDTAPNPKTLVFTPEGAN